MTSREFGNYLDFLFPNPRCELNYNSDYELLIAIVLSAQSTDKRVNVVTKELFEKYNSVDSLAKANLDDLENIIRPVGSFRRKAKYIIDISNILVNKYDRHVPTLRDVLVGFPGVGRKTANVFLSEFYNMAVFGVDTHVERVSKRLGIASADDNVLEIEHKLMEFFDSSEWSRRHLQMVLFGRYHCKAVKPNCDNCRLKKYCIKKISDNV